MSASKILANNNISMSQFNPGDIEGELSELDIFIEFHKSNSTCNVPNPNDVCQIGAFGPSSEGYTQSRNEFNPLSAIIGGGKLNFRMGYSDIEVVYVDVDMLASGPPDANFDSEVTESTGSNFEAATRFGSAGPSIYDHVLISIPYTEGSSSQTGLNEGSDVNISIPLLYDENWKLIWNTTANGTSGSALAGNHSHYETYSTHWQTLMGNNTCGTNQSALNSTNPCYIDTDNDKIWIRLPHFSGTKPSVTGSVITATSTDDSTTSSGGGGTGTASEWARQKVHRFTKMIPGVAGIMKDFASDVGIKQIQIQVRNEVQNVKITVRKYDGKPAAVSVEKSGKVNQYLEINTENLDESLDKAVLKIRVNKSWMSENSLEKENVSLFKFDEALESWNELTTDYVEEDVDYHYYDVELDSFSYFAIGEKSSEVEEEESIGKKIGEGIKDVTGISWTTILIILVILIVVIGAWLKFRVSRKE